MYIGIHIDKSINFFATGFRFGYKGKSFLITAKHVVVDKIGNPNYDLQYFFNTTTQDRIGSRSFKDLKEKEGLEWIFHPNRKVDLAIIPIQTSDEEIQKFVSEKDLKPVNELVETQDIISISYQPGTVLPKKINPVVRNGIISQLNNKEQFLMDGSIFPGNSGSPIYLKNSTLTKTYSELKEDEKPKLIGVVGAYVPYQDVAVSKQTGKTRVIFEENTGLSIVWPIDFLQEIFKTEKFIQQFKIIENRKYTNVKKEEFEYTEIE